MIIEFFGTLCEQCQKDISKRSRRSVAIGFTIVTILFGIVPTVVYYVLKDDYFYEFFGLTVLLVIMTVIYWLPINITRKLPQGISTDILIQIDGNYISRSGYTGVIKKPLSKVKKVIDTGDWYYVIFNRINDISASFVCQKDLIREGTLEQFEALFEGKIVRKYKY